MYNEKAFQEIAAEILNLNDFVLNNLSFTLNGRKYNFGKDICVRTALCPFSNTIVQFFFDAFWNKKLWDDPRVRLDYPFLYFFENKLFLPLHLYGVELGGKKGIKSVEMIHLHYPVPSTEHVSLNFSRNSRTFVKSLAIRTKRARMTMRFCNISCCSKMTREPSI
ncbi:unnamed protein product [Gongylonema pulchrum]|uniref:Uncharacterized protein n=1 Tax=Gongylonema pulchrum TaxID=637853 RepID=A0A183DF95_9BILA|nr:unnamed protein product [Gongylonema pulchrum]